MSIRNFVPEVWADRLNARLRAALVYGSVVNTDYEGEIANAGDTVRINSIGEVNIGDYVANSTTVTPEELVDAQTVLKIDQAKYFAFKVDDVDRAQAKAGAFDEAMTSGAYGLRSAIDTYIAGLYGDAASITGSTAIKSTNVSEALLALAQALDEANVPEEGRWCVLPPWMVTKMSLAKITEIQDGSTEAAAALEERRVARYAGFNILKSNNVYNDGTNYKIMAGTRKAISLATQVVQIEAYRPEASFSDAVKGLALFGAKVVYPDALAVLDATVGAEA